MSSAVASKSSQNIILSNKSDIDSFEKKYSQEEVTPSYLGISSDYFSQTRGVYRLFQLIAKACSWPILYAKELNLSSKVIKKLFAVKSKVKTGEKFLILPKMISDVKSLNDSYYNNFDEKNKTRKRDKLVKKIVETVVDCSIFLQLGEIIGIYTLGLVIGPAASFTGSLFLLFQHMLGLKMERKSFVFHRDLKEKEKSCIKDNKRLTTIFNEIKNLDLLKVTKSVVAIALSIFMLAEFVFSMAILSPTALLLLSTTTTILAIWIQFYQESMTYPYKC